MTEAAMGLAIPVAQHPETYLHDLGDGAQQYTHTWWDAPPLDAVQCADCGWSPTDIQAARRPDGTFDVTVTFGCYAGTDITAAPLNEAVTSLMAWRDLSPAWVDRVAAAMRKATFHAVPQPPAALPARLRAALLHDLDAATVDALDAAFADAGTRPGSWLGRPHRDLNGRTGLHVALTDPQAALASLISGVTSEAA